MFAIKFCSSIIKTNSNKCNKNILLYSKLLISTLNDSQHSLIKDRYNETESLGDSNSRLLKVAIIGSPNAGKSTFINNLADRKVCPASNKVHTTRKRSHAIITEDITQIVFLDTPGIVSNSELRRYKLENSFTTDCAKSLNEADIIGVIHDASNVWTRERLDIKIIRLLEHYRKRRSFLVLNKIDVLKSKRKLLDITKTLTESCINSMPYGITRFKPQSDSKGWPNFSEVFMVSSITGEGVQDIKQYLVSQSRLGKWLYPANQWTDHSPDDIIVRTVKATLLDFLPQEIPYKLKTNIELFEVADNGKMNAVVLVHCPLERIRKLVVGVGDGKLRQITEKAQKDLLHTFDQPIRLQIIVSVDK